MTWSSGDFHEVARQKRGDCRSLCDAVDPRPSQRVLDVACGSGTAALVAARRYCEVSGIDYVPELIGRASQRAQAEGFAVDLRVSDAQALPFDDASFDVVLSVYGVQFAPDQQRAADELLRVCRPGGRIGRASPMPEGWSGDLFATHARYAPPPPDVQSPLRWGTGSGLDELLGEGVRSVTSQPCTALQYYRSVEHAVQGFSRYFGPTLRALEAVRPEEQPDLLADLAGIFDRYNRAAGGTAVIENSYVRAVAVRADSHLDR